MWRAILLFSASVLAARDRIAAIDFYGSKGIDVAAVRSALPFHAGDPYAQREIARQARDAVLQATGHEATGVAPVCCDPNGDTYIFIGLPGQSSRHFALDAVPKGAARLPRELFELQKRIEAESIAALRDRGDGQEDDSQGYALAHDPAVRALQLQLRDYALNHEAELLRVAPDASDRLHRAYAIDALGYARQSPRQVAALVAAARDVDDDVRNNATRALGVLLEANPALASQVPPGVFIEMMSSGIWSDRNKSCFVLDHLSKTRAPGLLARLRAEAFDPLVEMASWRSPGHAACGKAVLARIAGATEDEINTLEFGPVETILERLKR